MKLMLEKLVPHIAVGAKLMLYIFMPLAVLVFVLQGLMAVFHYYPLDYGEAPLLDQAMRLAQGISIYRPDLSTHPYTISNYPPGYVLALTPFVMLFGPSFAYARAISLLSTLGTAFFLYGIITHLHKGDRFAGVVAAVVFLAFPYVVEWSGLARVDMLALLLSSAALYVAVRNPTTRRGLILTAALLVAAVYTRQSYALAAPFAAFVWMWTKDRRQALRLAGLVIVLGGLLFLILNLVTGGGFYFNIVTANVNDFSLARVGDYALGVLANAPLAVLLALALLVFGFRKVPSWPFIAAYLMGATASAFTVGKVGSNVNYLLELSAALSLAVGAAVAWMRQEPADAAKAEDLLDDPDYKTRFELIHKPTSQMLLGSLVFILVGVLLGNLMHASLTSPIEARKWRLKPKNELGQLNLQVEKSTDPVLAGEYMGLLTLQDRPLYIQPFEVTQLAKAGIWDQTPLLESIRAQEFSGIFIHNYLNWTVYKERWTPEMLAAIHESYVPMEAFNDSLVFRPLDPDASYPQDYACTGAPWQLPTSGEFGMYWWSGQLLFLGADYDSPSGADRIPVYAAADGLVTRKAEWEDALIIQHDDPLNPGKKVWTVYAGMAGYDGSYIVDDFPPGVESVPVEQGQLLGYQGRRFGINAPIYLHLQFAVIGAAEDGSFPEAMEPVITQDGELPDKEMKLRLHIDGILDPQLYLNIVGSPEYGQPVWIPMLCMAEAE
ncbi:MAG: glycosyltransferase family 39 protein [Anaerolineales bacterium]|nr:glycosyltransferase family 39 protein [Anaerolineales bacterium]